MCNGKLTGSILWSRINLWMDKFLFVVENCDLYPISGVKCISSHDDFESWFMNYEIRIRDEQRKTKQHCAHYNYTHVNSRQYHRWVSCKWTHSSHHKPLVIRTYNTSAVSRYAMVMLCLPFTLDTLCTSFVYGFVCHIWKVILKSDHKYQKSSGIVEITLNLDSSVLFLFVRLDTFLAHLNPRVIREKLRALIKFGKVKLASTQMFG